jgi:Protein of unknown function (DUF3140)
VKSDDSRPENDFDQLVNMSAAELKKWLKTPESQSVGASASTGKPKQAGDPGESVGHHSGAQIVAMLDTPRDKWSSEDHAHLTKVVGFIHRHLAQRPTKERIDDSRWRYSLMNWGHDPLKK